MKTISVILDDYTEGCLEKIVDLNKCTITDAVSMSLVMMAQETKPVLEVTQSLYQIVEELLQKNLHMNLGEYCEKVLEVRKAEVLALFRRVESGSEIYGFGSLNKWREKQDGRRFKTRSAWVAWCVKRDTGVCLETYDPNGGRVT